MIQEIKHRVREEVCAELDIEDLNLAPRLQIRAAAGLGKTSVVVEELSQRKIWHGRNVEIYVPTTELADEIAAKIRSNGLAACVMRGRSNGAPDYPMCEKYNAADQAAKLGLRVYSTLCKRIGPDGSELACEFFNDCPYIAQWQDTGPAVRIFAHNYLGLPRPRPDQRGLPAPDLVIIDENAIQRLIVNCQFGLDGLDDFLRDAVLKHIDENIDLRQVLRECGITAASARQIAKNLRESIETAVRPTMPELKALKLLRAARQLEEHKHAQFWDRVAAEIDRDRPFHGIEVCANERVLVDGQPEYHHRIHVHWPRHPVIKQSTPLLMIDADADLEINQRFFGSSLQSVEIKAVRNAHITQCYSSRFTKMDLLGSDAKSAPEYTRKLQKAVCVVEKEAQRGGKILLVTSKQIHTFLTSLDSGTTTDGGGCHNQLKSRPDVAIAHFNNIRGSNEWAEYDTVVIVGREEPPPKVVERLVC